MTLFWGLVLMGFGLMTWGPLLEAGLTVASLPFGSLLGLFLLGTLNRRANAVGALTGMFAGLFTILCVWRANKCGLHVVCVDWQQRNFSGGLARESFGASGRSGESRQPPRATSEDFRDDHYEDHG